MLSFKNIRMDRDEEHALRDALEDVDEEVYVLGSRLNPGAKGGDIDLLIFSKQDSLNLSRKIARRFFLQCEEKIDVLVFDKDNLSEEQRSFLNTLKLVRIK
ncbi:MAG TPA: nucleotidyltransferase domain-containing protein [Ignavibacteriaceae bacterium]|nr:nucleotidyltransferase domain-containing protein [Ignavibacteriaceae bacterium]